MVGKRCILSVIFVQKNDSDLIYFNEEEVMTPAHVTWLICFDFGWLSLWPPKTKSTLNISEEKWPIWTVPDRLLASSLFLKCLRCRGFNNQIRMATSGPLKAFSLFDFSVFLKLRLLQWVGNFLNTFFKYFGKPQPGACLRILKVRSCVL